MFLAAEKLHAKQALGIGLIDAVVDDPVEETLSRIRKQSAAAASPHSLG
jgi:enoyl-CoA hydratase/carnithine racemase